MKEMESLLGKIRTCSCRHLTKTSEDLSLYGVEITKDRCMLCGRITGCTTSCISCNGHGTVSVLNKGAREFTEERCPKCNGKGKINVDLEMEYVGQEMGVQA